MFILIAILSFIQKLYKNFHGNIYDNFLSGNFNKENLSSLLCPLIELIDIGQTDTIIIVITQQRIHNINTKNYSKSSRIVSYNNTISICMVC